MTGDLTGDGRADLVFGRIVGSSTVRWYVKASSGRGFGSSALWALDAGIAGDIFRRGDVDGDRRADLVYGRPETSNVVTWFVRLSGAAAFNAFETWAEDAGRRSDLFLIGHVTGDGRADLIPYDRGLFGGTATTYSSTVAGFSLEAIDHQIVLDHFDYILMGDADGDGAADLVAGLVDSTTDVDWAVFESNGCASFLIRWCFDAVGEGWASDAGDAGDLFRLGDGDGDGRVDLFYARPIGITSLVSAPDLTRIRWYGRLSDGSSFGPFSTWADAGDEGDIVP